MVHDNLEQTHFAGLHWFKNNEMEIVLKNLCAKSDIFCPATDTVMLI